MKRNSKILSKFRKLYQNRLILRCAVLVLTVLIYIFFPEQFQVMYGFNFFRSFSVFHVLWLLWIFDMVMQLIPSVKFWPLGSQKFLKSCFDPILDYIDRGKRDSGLLEFIYKSNRTTLKVGGIWLALTAVIGVLYFTDVLPSDALLVISVIFYVCDVICVLYWCPFRVLFMKNRCCTTCRIFNWDHMMMFSPVVFIPGVFTWSLCAMALVVFLAWEIAFALHPERFWEGTNTALKCANCTDRLCGERLCQVDVPFNNKKQP